jgi:hypothetical protein
LGGVEEGGTGEGYRGRTGGIEDGMSISEIRRRLLSNQGNIGGGFCWRLGWFVSSLLPLFTLKYPYIASISGSAFLQVPSIFLGACIEQR